MRSTFEIVTRRLVVLAAATSLTGCSLFLTHGPSSTPPAPGVAVSAPDCTTSMAFPAIDGSFAALMAIILLSAAGERNSANEEELSGDAAATMMLVTGAATVSALVGYSRVNKCRRANETFVASYGFGQAAPAYPYAAQYPQQYPPQYPAQQYPPQQPQQPAYQPAYPQVQPAPPVAQPPPPVAQPIGPTPPATVAQPQPRPQPSALVAQPRPQPPAAQPAPRPIAKPQPKPQPKPAPAADASLGTEGDVCTTQSECASGFTCTGNVCLKKQ